MEITQFKYFEVLARLEHMTQAANALHMAQPALSRSISNLEEKLGFRLFDRVGKHILLNEYGKILLRHVSVMLRELEDAERELRERKGDLDKKVSISMNAGSKLLVDIIKGFKEQYPDISLEIIQHSNLDDAVERCDVTLYSSIEPAAGRNRVTLIEEEICIALPAVNPLSQRESVALYEVKNEPFICLHKGKGLRTVTDEFCRMAGFTPNIVLESDSPNMVRDLIALGVGVAFVPMITWRNMGFSSLIKLLKVSDPPCRRYLNLQWKSENSASRASTLFRKYLTSFFEQIKAQEEEKQ